MRHRARAETVCLPSGGRVGAFYRHCQGHRGSDRRLFGTDRTDRLRWSPTTRPSRARRGLLHPGRVVHIRARQRRVQCAPRVIRLRTPGHPAHLRPRRRGAGAADRRPFWARGFLPRTWRRPGGWALELRDARRARRALRLRAGPLRLIGWTVARYASVASGGPKANRSCPSGSIPWRSTTRLTSQLGRPPEPVRVLRPRARARVPRVPDGA